MTDKMILRWRRPVVGTRACSLNVQPNSKVGDAALPLRTEPAAGLRTRRRYAPTPPPHPLAERNSWDAEGDER